LRNRQFFAKQMKTSKSNCNSNFKKRILRFFDFCRRCRERERERRSSCCPISQNLFYQAPHIFFEQALSEASLLSRLFICLFACCCNCRSSKIRFVSFVFVCLA
jgi:hypothetical protein